MFIHVRLLKGFPKPLTYKVPAAWPQENFVGQIVHVPIQNRTEHALVIAQTERHPAVTFEIKEALAVERIPQDTTYTAFLDKLSDYYHLEPLHFFKRMRSFVEQEKESIRGEILQPHHPQQPLTPITLTHEQHAVTDFIIDRIQKATYTPTVLHGVTGSGKTECYKKMICAALDCNKSAILLLPEVTLALQFEHLLRAQLPATITIHAFHSACTARDKKILWRDLLQKNKPMLIIGVHLPILLPINNLGLIIVDEEHEVGYQEKKHPKINSKEAALIRAQLTGIPIVLGSATPSLNSLYNVRSRSWYFFELKQRFAGAFPVVKTVFLSDKKYRRNFWISQELETALRNRLEQHEQTIIFINRRGYSFFVQCTACGFIFECPHCSVSLTLHEHNVLTCHYCEYTTTLATRCSSCSQENSFIKKGIGTQQVVSILEKMFPQARIGRADLDVTRKKTSWHETLDGFEKGTIDILVGTQTITKGFHFPKVTLVGILWADLNLHFPVYNATETTLQQLIQVAGRAGRQSNESLVIVQAMRDHPVFQYLNEANYPRFYENEMENRRLLNYPPYGRLAELELKNTNETLVQRDAEHIAACLMQTAQQLKLPVRILGPAQPPVSRIKQMHSRKIYIKGAGLTESRTLWQAVRGVKITSQLFFTPSSV
jgi:primosomal protein N' (replication factor Y) (superfamily II helicase)